MGGVKKYFQKEFRSHMFSLEHEDSSDFSMSSCQKNRSAFPLLCIRLLVFLGCLGILLASIILMSRVMSFAYWPIFLTHWGLVLITLTSGCSVVVSLRAYFIGPIDATFGLPWYVKTYWALYNMTVPIAFFITLFYWALLTAAEEDFALDPVLDVFIHAVNAVLMLVLLIFSRHPSRLLHFYYPLVATIIYLIFSIAYYYAGGTDPYGNNYIYPMLDWSRPGLAAVTVIGSALTLLVMHALVVIISLGRNWLTKRYWISASNQGLFL